MTTRIVRLITPTAEGHAPEQLYRIAEAAGLLSVCRRTVVALIDRGELDVVGEGRLTRVPASAIAAYQRRHRRTRKAS